MTTALFPRLAPRFQQAIDELKGIILAKYPTTTFIASTSEENDRIIHLDATVDVDDTDDVLALVLDRMVDMQVDEGIPLYVIPQRRPIPAAASSETHHTDAATLDAAG